MHRICSLNRKKAPDLQISRPGMLSKPSISDLRLPNILSQPSQLQASSLSDVKVLYEHFYIIASVKQTKYNGMDAFFYEQSRGSLRNRGSTVYFYEFVSFYKTPVPFDCKRHPLISFTRLPKPFVPSCFEVFIVYHVPAMKDPNFLPNVAGRNISAITYCYNVLLNLVRADNTQV